MCSVLGVYRLNKNTKIEDVFFEQGFEVLRHRGPDSEFIEAIDETCTLGHQRLAIIDIHEHGNQPMNVNSMVISYNGELYNYQELSKELGEACASDTEVFLKSFQKDGIACLNKFNGMFAAAIYDKQSKKLFLIRDRFGVKPLYYTIQNDVMYFASEMQALIQIKTSIKKNIEYFSNYCRDTATDYGESTYIEDIYQVESGSFVEVNSDGLSKKRWYFGNDFNFDTSIFDSQEATIDFVEDLLTDAIRLRLISDVPVGMTLSGGIDSSLIYTLIKEKLQYPIKTFSYFIPNSPANEATLINQLVEKYDDEVIKIYHDDTMDMKLLYKGVAISEFPIWNISYEAYLKTYETIKTHGYKVILEGHGSDEFLAGYDFMHENLIYDYLKAKKYVDALKVLIISKKTSNFKKLNNLGDEKLFFKKILFEKNKIKGNFVTFNEMRERVTQYSILPIALRGFDRFSMASSIESRSPFMDYRLIEVFKKLPPKYIVNKIGNKAILREILKKYGNDFIYKNKVKIGFCADIAGFYKSKTNIEATYQLISKLSFEDCEDCQKLKNVALQKLNNPNLSWSETFEIGKATMLAIFNELNKRVFDE